MFSHRNIYSDIDDHAGVDQCFDWLNHDQWQRYFIKQINNNLQEDNI